MGTLSDKSWLVTRDPTRNFIGRVGNTWVCVVCAMDEPRARLWGFGQVWIGRERGSGSAPRVRCWMDERLLNKLAVSKPRTRREIKGEKWECGGESVLVAGLWAKLREERVMDLFCVYI